MTQQTHSPNPNPAELGHDEPSGLSYNPRPYPGASPYPADWYERTGIGYLYGLLGCDEFAYLTAGWTVVGLIDFEEVPLEDE